MASGNGHESDFRRIASKETNSAHASGDAGTRSKPGIATPRKNPTMGDGVNRSKRKSSMQ